ncbi:alpha/beta hydrolase-fold protein [Aquimarina sp. 2201CG1-2-11]|uniref:alpha/beta hydrolase family esterase n=1 Tax=Aquimarina discodermiae TaxID=3231043 RepID=UPI0034624480
MMKKYAPFIFMLLMMGMVACSSGDDSEDTPDPVTTPDPDPTPDNTLALPDKGEKQITTDFSSSAGGERSFYISVPNDYSSATAHKLVVVFPGTNGTGKGSKDWMGDGWSGSVTGLEQKMTNTIFVYPDPKFRNFPNWGTLGGWQLGPQAGNANGVEDINFIKELLDLIEKEYNIDSDRIFATGQSWGGDMAAIVACFMGDKFRAVAPNAANRPYWFENNGSFLSDEVLGCSGNTAVWTFFGLDDEHYASQQDSPGDFGKEQNDYWLNKYGCSTTSTTLNVGGVNGQSKEYQSCSTTVRFTLYSPGQYSGGGSQPGHQPPDFFLTAVPEWFNSF